MMPLAAVPTRPSAELAETRDLIHEVCRKWDAGTMPLAEVRSRTTGAERNLAMRLTDQGGPMWAPMGRMFAELVATDPTSQYGYHYATRQGVFSDAELSGAEARMTKTDDGRIRILFPIRHPWRRRPGKDEAGERGVPVYAATFEERWELANSARRPEPSNRTYLDDDGNTF